MSNTDKDTPWRIREYFDGDIDHDHRTGECIVETFNDAKLGYVRHSHYSRCAKRSRVEIPCPGAGYGRDLCATAMDEYRELDIYARMELRVLYDPKRYKCTTRKYPHWKFEYDETIHCQGCEDIAARVVPTCDYSLPRHKGGGYCRGGVPSWYVSMVYHRPQRRKTNDELHDAKREYNAHGETDIEPEPTQARNSARWLWW